MDFPWHADWKGYWERCKFDDNGSPTRTSTEQKNVEAEVLANYVSALDKQVLPSLHKQDHVHYLRKSLMSLSAHNEHLDASRAWMVYWTLHSLELLDFPIAVDDAVSVMDFFRRCQNSGGGFGGGPGQNPHLAPTYAAVCSLCILGKSHPPAYDVIDRPALYRFLLSLRNQNGSFKMDLDGETDIRALYCAVSVACLTNVIDPSLFLRSAEWALACQTYEGGFGGVPMAEAHGGYTYCALAALVLLGKEEAIHVDRLTSWVVRRQLRLEGGFQGRVGKLVDGCYSFWLPGVLLILKTMTSVIEMEGLLFDRLALRMYLLVNCQYPLGGFRDKPGMSRDLYHTCYCLSGLSLAQEEGEEVNSGGGSVHQMIPLNPLYNITKDAAHDALQHFGRLGSASVH